VRSAVTDLFLRLVAIPSPSGRERRVAAFIADWLAGEGIASELDGTGGRNDSDSGNLLATVPGASGAPRHLFVAHMDTVESGATAIEPELSPDGVIRARGDRILGADNKSGVAGVMRLCRAVARMPEDRRPTVQAAFTSREESGLMGASLLDLAAGDIDCAFCVDGSKPIGTVITQALGQTVFDVVIRGRAAHAAANPGAGIDAIRVASEIVAALALGRQPHGGSLNVAAVVGGALVDRLGEGARDGGGARDAPAVLQSTATNLVPDCALLRGEARAYEAEALEATLGEVQRTVAAVCAAHGAGHEWRIDTATSVPPFPRREDSTALELFKAAVDHVPGARYVLEQGPFTLEANHLAPLCDTIAIASGGRDAHEPTESITTAELDQLEAVLVGIAERAAAGSGGGGRAGRPRGTSR
jgi:acetylornithine deacetylase/succinyl-diaminopimelate desuccinylase-like protein